MPTIGSTPCQPWAGLDDLCDECSAYVQTAPDDLLRFLDVASELLYEMTGRQFPGACTSTIRPCAQSVYDSLPPSFIITPGYDYINYPRLWSGYCNCNRGRQCGCIRISELNLGPQPILDINNVKVDGVVLSPSLYEVHDNHWLVRLPDPDDSRPGWPCCQYVDLPDTADNTFSITLTRGFQIPSPGVLAAASLACQLFLACNPGTGNCRLPSNVTSAVRQGFTYTTSDLLALFNSRRTGISEVDLFLSVYAPKGEGWGGVLSPDLTSRYRTKDTLTGS